MILALHGGVFKQTRAYEDEMWAAYQAMCQACKASGTHQPFWDLSDLSYLAPSGIVAVATLAAVTTNSSSPWAVPGQQHWLLEDVVVLEQPIAYRGAQGLWTIEPDALKQIEAQTGRSWA